MYLLKENYLLKYFISKQEDIIIIIIIKFFLFLGIFHFNFILGAFFSCIFHCFFRFLVRFFLKFPSLRCLGKHYNFSEGVKFLAFVAKKMNDMAVFKTDYGFRSFLRARAIRAFSVIFMIFFF